LAFVPSTNQAFGILKQLSVGRAACGRFLFRGLPALIFHLAAVEAHVRIVTE
jgi:hypothetical protein